ncbi:Zn-dependent hydrolase OS=Streptomyces antimycoticus OX=68175 GN=SSPO_059520 PE=3 SV=1 [Streptomyces antimycoticus]
MGNRPAEGAPPSGSWGRDGWAQPTDSAAPAHETPSFHEMWRDLAPVGREKTTGGYRRYAWTEADADCRAWFKAQTETLRSTYGWTATATNGPLGDGR